jgi:soluble P-type ATPase
MSQESRDKLEQITQELRHLKMEARNNNVVSQFKKKFVERGNSAELKVIIISNVDHQAYVDGPGANHRPILPVAETGILELRAHLCEKPALDRVLGNIRQIKEVLRYCQRILLCISTPQLLRRETVTTLFANRAQMPFAKYHDMMTEGVKSFRKSVLMKLKADWNQPLLSLMDDFSKTYTSCLAAFFRKGGVHWPTVKRIKANSSVDLNRLILNKTIDDLAILENKTYTVADRCIDDIINDLTGKVQDVKSELERLPQIGGANLNLVFQFFDRETKACTEQITESVEELKERMRYVLFFLHFHVPIRIVLTLATTDLSLPML